MLAGSTVASTGLTAITGDVGVSPGSAITGFPPATVTSGAVHANDVAAAQAHADAAIAYDFLKGMPSLAANNRSGTDLGGLTLAPGVYKFNSSAALTGDLTLDAGGDSGALFVFQIGSSLTTASGAHVVVINGGADYDESNVFWQVGSSATLGSGTAFTGNILAYASISFVTGSTLTGNALALIGGVTMEGNAITSPSPAAAPIPAPGAPAAPINLTAVPLGPIVGPGFRLVWADASVDETGFLVYRRDGAGPDFVLIGSIVSTDTAGTSAVLTFEDRLLDPSTTFTYRVTAFSAASVESVPSNEARAGVPVVVPAATLALKLRLGRGHSSVRDRTLSDRDALFVMESYSVVDIGTQLPVALGNKDPRIDGITIQVRAPGNLVFLNIPANDPRWKASKHGVYTWKTEDGGQAPHTSFRIDTRRSVFTFRSERNEFSSLPVNSITVSLTYLTATGSDTRAWRHPKRMPRGTKALFTLPR